MSQGVGKPTRGAGVRFAVPDLPQAICASSADPDLWYSPREADQFVAVRLCRQCPELRACDRWADEHEERYGIWAGLRERQRTMRRHGLPIGRADERAG